MTRPPDRIGSTFGLVTSGSSSHSRRVAFLQFEDGPMRITTTFGWWGDTMMFTVGAAFIGGTLVVWPDWWRWYWPVLMALLTWWPFTLVIVVWVLVKWWKGKSSGFTRDRS